MFLNYFALPSMELLLRSGGFGLQAKLRDSVGQIAKLASFLLAAALVGTLVLCALADAWRDGDFLAQLQAAAIGVSNTLGLVLPQAVWREADLAGSLARGRRAAVAEYRARDDARTQLGMALDDCYR
jgi:hypothetical protein